MSLRKGIGFCQQSDHPHSRWFCCFVLRTQPAKAKSVKQKETILDAYTRMVFLIYDRIGKKEVNL